MASVASKLYADDVSLLVLLLDTNPLFWSNTSIKFSQFLSHVFAFLNAVLGLNQLNQVIVIATGYTSCDYIYDSSSTSNHGSLESSRTGMPALFASFIEKLEAFITKDEELINEDRIGSSLLSGSLSMALCLILKLWNDMKLLSSYIGGSHDRLNEKWFMNRGQFAANVTIEHYLQVVKTEVVSRRFGQEHSLISEYEYTAHSNVAHGYYYPVAKFHFELSPMQILITESPRSFSHFITNVCAIIGGVFTVAGILDSIFQSTVRLVKKIELGKNI